MPKKKQVFKCNSKLCQSETTCIMPILDWLQVEIVACSNCGQLIAFSTIYSPKRLIRNSVNLP